MQKLQYLLAILFGLLFCECQKEDIRLLSGCCGHQPFSESFGNARIFFPNIFTPNGDNINDILYVQGDSIYKVIDFKVTNRRGDLVFQTDNTNANDASKGWDGKFNGLVQKGLYSVFLTIEALDGTTGSVQGKVCNYPCGNVEIEVGTSIKNCLFPDYWPCIKNFDGCLSLDFPECFE